MRTYRERCEGRAVILFDEGTLSMGQAARLLDMPLGDFVDLRDRLGVPVLRESERSVAEQVDSFEQWLEGAGSPGDA